MYKKGARRSEQGGCRIQKGKGNMTIINKAS